MVRWSNAKAVLKSSELKLGRIYREASPFKNLVREFRYHGVPIHAGTRLPKNSVIQISSLAMDLALLILP